MLLVSTQYIHYNKYNSIEYNTMIISKQGNLKLKQLAYVVMFLVKALGRHFVDTNGHAKLDVNNNACSDQFIVDSHNKYKSYYYAS